MADTAAATADAATAAAGSLGSAGSEDKAGWSAASSRPHQRARLRRAFTQGLDAATGYVLPLNTWTQVTMTFDSGTV